MSSQVALIKVVVGFACAAALLFMGVVTFMGLVRGDAWARAWTWLWILSFANVVALAGTLSYAVRTGADQDHWRVDLVLVTSTVVSSIIVVRSLVIAFDGFDRLAAIHGRENLLALLVGVSIIALAPRWQGRRTDKPARMRLGGSSGRSWRILAFLPSPEAIAGPASWMPAGPADPTRPRRVRSPSRQYFMVKRVEDGLLGLALLILLAPFMACIAIAVKLSSPGPVLYRQKRHGLDRQVIEILKFRTMYVDRCDEAGSGRVIQAIRGDARITPLGRLLRRSSLDELPQLLNVVRGEMSLVGPRPHAIAHDRYYASRIDGYMDRYRVRPGMTGWAQINGLRGETRTVEEMRRRVEYDLAYARAWSIRVDLMILWRTIFLGFVGSKAY